MEKIIDRVVFLRVFDYWNHDRLHPIYKLMVSSILILIIGLIFWIPAIALCCGLMWAIILAFAYFWKNSFEIWGVKF